MAPRPGKYFWGRPGCVGASQGWLLQDQVVCSGWEAMSLMGQAKRGYLSAGPTLIRDPDIVLQDSFTICGDDSPITDSHDFLLMVQELL